MWKKQKIKRYDVALAEWFSILLPLIRVQRILEDTSCDCFGVFGAQQVYMSNCSYEI